MKDLILIAFGLVIIVTGVWLLWPDSGNAHNNIDAENKIIFTCGDFAFAELCLINTDGSGLVQLTNLDEQNKGIDENPINTNLAPAFNKNGQIAWHCNRDGTLSVDGEDYPVPGGFNYICVMNLDGSDYRIFEDRNYIPNVLINDQGQIFYGCDQKVICRINFDGSDKREFEVGFYLTSFLLDASLTENSLILNCPEYDESDSTILVSRNLCAMDQANGRITVITDSSMHEYIHASSNNGNLIFMCTIESLFGSFDICLWEDGSRNIIVDPVEEVDFSTLTINDAGQAAVNCGIDNVYHLCLIRGDSYESLEYEMDYESPLAINAEGIIAFFCEIEEGGLCVVNHDGTGFKRLLENSNIETSTLRGGLDIQ